MIAIAEILARLQSSGLLLASGPETDLTVVGISDDSREVGPGDLYCAISGYANDGHRFLSDAAEAGAVASLVETPDPNLDFPQIHVSSSRRAASIAAQAVFGDPAAELELIGVTGTNGKTTTVELARHILNRGIPTGSLGTLGVTDAAGNREETSLTTPGPIDFARRLADLRKSGVAAVVAEVSSHALVQERVAGVTFQVGVFTNLSRDHLDYHADLEEYRATKARLVDLVSEDGTLVINADEPAWTDLKRRGRSIRYGLGGDCDYTARDVQLGRNGSRWMLVGPDAEVEVELPLLGEFNVLNALAAAAIAGAEGFDVGMAAESLATAPTIPGRLEVLAEEPLVLRDYAHTPDALRRALSALRPLVNGRLIAVFGCGGDRDAGKRGMMGQAAAEGADYTIVTSDNPRSESPGAIIEAILPGLGDAPHEKNEDRRAAIARALEIAGPEDAVLLAGKGHETYQIVGDDRKPFDEALIVQEILATQGEP